MTPSPRRIEEATERRWTTSCASRARSLPARRDRAPPAPRWRAIWRAAGEGAGGRAPTGSASRPRSRATSTSAAIPEAAPALAPAELRRRRGRSSSATPALAVALPPGAAGRARRDRGGAGAARGGDVRRAPDARPANAHVAPPAPAVAGGDASASSHRRACGCSCCATAARRWCPSRPPGPAARQRRGCGRRRRACHRGAARPRDADAVRRRTSSPRAGDGGIAGGVLRRQGVRACGPSSCPATRARAGAGRRLLSAHRLSGAGGRRRAPGAARGPAARRGAGTRSGTAGGAAPVPARRCGRTPRGAPAAEALSALTRVRLLDRYRRNYPLGRLVVAVVGDVDPTQVVAAVTALFPGVPAGSPPAASAPPAAAPRRPRARQEPTTVFRARSRRRGARRHRLPDLRARRSESRGGRGAGRDPRRRGGRLSGALATTRRRSAGRARGSRPGSSRATSRCGLLPAGARSTRRWRRCAPRSAGSPPTGSRPTR